MQEEKEKINWAKIKYAATVIGLSQKDLMHLKPSELYEMVELYCDINGGKYGNR